MKQLSIAFLALIASTALFAQSTQMISTGAGYQKQSYVNLAAGTEKQVNNTAWDIAFTVFGTTDAGVFVNESSGSVSGAPQPQVEVYNSLTDNFADQPDPASLVDFILYNAEKTWSYGAFNETRDTTNALDYGWGQLDNASGQIIGSLVYVIKLRNEQYRKIKIESYNNGVYTFKYANVDGSNEVTKTVNKADYPGKTLAYFSFETGTFVDVEPATGSFDLLYCRYITPLHQPGTNDYVPYNVTGIIAGPGVQVAEADGVDPATVSVNDFLDSLRSDIDVIGYDWKAFPSTSWVLDADRVFFVKTTNEHIWKIYFTAFVGSTTGKATFQKTDLGIISAVQDPGVQGLEAGIYPNPVQDRFNVALDLSAAWAQQGQLEVCDLLGRTVTSRSVNLKEGFQVFEIGTSDLNSGIYIVRLNYSAKSVVLGKVEKM